MGTKETLLAFYEGVKGNGLKAIGKKGRILICLANGSNDVHSVTFDKFIGSGDTYTELNETQITITNNDEKFIFPNFTELIIQLKK